MRSREPDLGTSRDRFGVGLSALVVEDDANARALACRMLEVSGFTVESADTFEAAAARCVAKGFDLVLTDKQLPGGSGLALARLLYERNVDCEVVMMTAHSDMDSAVAALQARVADYIVKPFRLNDALTRIRRVTRMQARKRRNRALVEQVRSVAREPAGQSAHDPLTNLFNHATFMQRFDDVMRRHRRDQQPFSVVLINVDRFKEANEKVGHAAGDGVLRVLGDMIGGASSGTIAPLGTGDALAARHGGDEFVLVLPGTNRAAAVAKAEQLRTLVEQYPFEPGLGPITVSVGVAEGPADGESRTSLLHAAATALFIAKAMGRNRVVGYTPLLASVGLDRTIADDQEMRELLALDRSLKARAFSFAYQPIVKANTHEILGYEGLCRPLDRTFKSASHVFACAERNHRILELGRMVREMVVRPMPRLPRPERLFVNLHPYELYDSQLLDMDASLDPWADRLVLEVTEVGAVRDYGRLREALQQLRNRGFRIALDDLGSGYSGLNCLAQLPADFVKLDIGMLSRVNSDSRSARLIKHILEFAQGEDIQVIAEGVETDEECAVVAELGCPLLQGYGIACPAAPFVQVMRVEPPQMTLVTPPAKLDH